MKTILTPLILVAVVVSTVPADKTVGKPAGKPVVKAEDSNTRTWTDAKTAAAEFAGFAFLGEYVHGDQAIQVLPCEGQFYLSIYNGGLPGDGWDRQIIKHEWVDADVIADRLQCACRR